jgi:putative inorganic carbon (HCO3(-)) transporter
MAMNEKTQIYLNKLAVFCLMAIVAASPFAIKRIFERPTISQNAFIQLSMVSIGLLYFPILLFSRPVSLKPSRSSGFLVLFLSSTILSSLLSGNPLYSLMEMHFIFPFILFYFIFQSLRISKQGLGKIILIPILISIPIVLYGLLQSFNLDILGYTKAAMFEKKKIVSFMGNPNFAGSYIAPLFPLTLGMVMISQRKAMRLFFLGTSLMQILFLLLAGSRASWLGILLGIGLLFVLTLKCGMIANRRFLKNAITILAILLILLLISLVFIDLPFSLSHRLFSTPELYYRFFIWQISTNIFLDHPLLGIGYHQLPNTINEYVFDFFTRHPRADVFQYILKKGTVQRYLHNDYLEILVETGILGFLAFMCLIISIGIRSWKQILSIPSGREERFFHICLLSGFVTILADAFWGFPLQLPCSGILFWLFLSVMEKYRTLLEQKSNADLNSLYREESG